MSTRSTLTPEAHSFVTAMLQLKDHSVDAYAAQCEDLRSKLRYLADMSMAVALADTAANLAQAACGQRVPLRSVPRNVEAMLIRGIEVAHIGVNVVMFGRMALDAGDVALGELAINRGVEAVAYGHTVRSVALRHSLIAN